MLLRARIVLPVAAPPIEDGAVWIEGDKIREIGPWKELSRKGPASADLGEVILLPGLINAHCHLDYTHMAGKIPPRKSFADWIKAMVALKSSWTEEEFAVSWSTGAEMLLKNGTTTVADIECMPQLLPQVWASTPLRVFSCHELIHIKPETSAGDLVNKAEQQGCVLDDPRKRFGLSPHAPYTTNHNLLQLAQQTAKKHGWLLTSHLAESEEEFQMFMDATGPLHDWLKNQRGSEGCGSGSPIAYMESANVLSSYFLAAHVNYLAPQDAQRLCNHQVKVVHCPSSHQYFKHQKFPFEELDSWGIPVSLGTDSLASYPVSRATQVPPELNMFQEMQRFATNYPTLSPERILRTTTLDAARCLGCQGNLGELSPGSQADLINIPFTGQSDQAAEAVLRFSGRVTGSMIQGEWALPPSTI